MASFYPQLYQRALSLLVIARERAGMSQKDWAEQFGQPEALVTSYERGERLLDAGEFVAIARAIGADPYELLREAEDEA